MTKVPDNNLLCCNEILRQTLKVRPSRRLPSRRAESASTLHMVGAEHPQQLVAVVEASFDIRRLIHLNNLQT
jgi:hypothetical protein